MDERPVRWQLGWWGWFLIATGLLGLVTVAFALWLHSNGDLDAEMGRARSLGLATDWPSLNPPGPPHADIIAIQRLSKIAERSMKFSDPGNTQWEVIPFLPPPADLATWRDGVESELDPLLDGLSGHMVWSINAPAVADALHRGDANWLVRNMIGEGGRSDVLDIVTWRSGRGSDEAHLHADRLARLATTITVPALTEFMISLRLAESWQVHVMRHRISLDPQRTAAGARALAGKLDAELPRLIAAWPLVLNHELRLPAEALFLAANIRLPAIMENPFGMSFFFRNGRKVIVARDIDLAQWVAIHGLPTTCAQVHAASPPYEPLTLFNFSHELLSELMDQGWCAHCHGQRVGLAHAIMQRNLRCTTGLRLLAADLDGSPWPMDPGAPPGGLIRPILRDGVMIGGYGLGLDGVDDGGNPISDWCWALHAQLGYPKASDLPKIP